MRRAICLLIGWLLLGQCFAFEQLYAADKAVIKSASEYDYPPFCVVSPDGKADGFSVELLREALSAVNLEVEFKTGPWDALKKELGDGSIQVLPLVGRTPERETIFDFTFPYLTLHGAVFVRKGDTRIKQVTDLADKTVVVMRGDNAEEFARRTNISSHIVAVDTYAQAMQLLEAGKYDAVIAQRLMGIVLLNKINIKKVVPLDFVLTDFRQDFCFAVRNGNRALLSTLNEGLSIIIANGTFERLHKKWLGPILKEQIAFKDVAKYVLIVFILTVALMSALAIFALKREVKRKTKSLIQEIAERKQIQEARETSLKLLNLLNSEDDLHGTIKSVCNFLHDWSGCEAVGIRLHDKSDFPYFETRGFPTEFIQGENSLCVENLDGQLERDDTGNPVLECMCGSILCGRFDPSKPFFTTQGSFWSNCTTELLASTTETDHQARTRNRCNGEGYESVALIPLRMGHTTFGLIQLNDKRIGRFTPKLIEEVEQFGSSIAICLAQRKSYHKLQESEEHHRTILQTAMDGYWRVDLQGHLLEVNESYGRMSGYSREELLAKNIQDLEALETANDTAAHMKKVMTQGEDRFESRHCRKDGSIFDVEVSVQYSPSEGGQLVVFLRDITERKQVEEALQAAKIQLANALEIAHLGHWEYDVATDIFTFNDPFYKIFRTTVEQCGGYTMQSAEYARRFVHPDDMFMVGEETRKAIETTDPKFNRQIEHRMLYADGMVGYISVRFLIVKDSHGRTVKTYGMNQDITERKQAEESLRKSEKHLRAILDATPFPIALVDVRDNNIDFWSRSALSLFGHVAPTATEWYQLAYPDPDYQRDVIERWKPFLEIARKSGQTVNTGEYRVTCNDGSVRICELYATFLTDILIVTFNDITERKRAELERQNLQERLQRSEKMEALGQLAGGVAHDLNNVLGVSTIYSELLQEQLPEGSPLRKYADNNLSAMQKAAAIIEDLLTLARRSVAVSEVMNLNRVASDFLKNPVFERIKDFHPQVTFRTDLDPELLNIKGSPVHLEKVVTNLISNAADAISGAGEVTIRTENQYLDKPIGAYTGVKEGEYAVLTVADTGTGIPAENMGKIFEPFFTKKTMGRSGTGLGLAIVWGTVKDHDGYIDVKSREGEGTTFTLYFPVSREELTAQRQKVPIEQYMGKGESVLVIDDIAEQREIATNLLARLKYKVHSVSGGEEAVEYLKTNKADILVLDMIMAPGIDGLETYRRVLEINPKQKAIIVSGFSETDRVKEAQKLGAGAYVKKPYVTEKIGVAIRDELDRK